MGIPALDLSTLKNVKDYKDWYGYSQKLEDAIRLLREKTEVMEKEIDMRDLHIMKLEKQNESLNAQIATYVAQNKNLKEKYQELMEKNFKSQKQQDLEPMFKPIHSKTMSLVGMLKQYATGGQASNEATERLFSPLKRERQDAPARSGGAQAAAAVDNDKRTRRRSEGVKNPQQRVTQGDKGQLQMISDLDENESDEDRAVEMLGLRDIKDLGPPELPKVEDHNASFGAE